MMGMVSFAEAQAIQAPALEIAVGYRNLPPYSHGWFASAARPLSDRSAIVGEVGYARYSEGGRPRARLEHLLYTFLGGVRFARRSPRVTPFVEALTGVLKTTTRRHPGDTYIFYGQQHFIVLQVGAGADIQIGRRAAVRIGIRLHTPLSSSGMYPGLLFTAGYVVGIGSR